MFDLEPVLCCAVAVAGKFFQTLSWHFGRGGKFLVADGGSHVASYLVAAGSVRRRGVCCHEDTRGTHPANQIVLIPDCRLYKNQSDKSLNG
jgi:hypothetical protein